MLYQVCHKALFLLYMRVRTPSDFCDLQSNIDSLVQWISDQDLKLNVKEKITSIVKEKGGNMYSNCGG